MAALAEHAGLGRTLCKMNGVTLITEDFREQFPDSDFIINYEYFSHTSKPWATAEKPYCPHF